MAKIYSAQNGNWDSASTWTGGVVPGPGDDAYIVNNYTVTMNVSSITCDNIYLYNDTNTSNTGGVLSLGTGAFTINANISNRGIITSAQGKSCIYLSDGLTTLDIYGDVICSYHQYGLLYRPPISPSIPCTVNVHGNTYSYGDGGRSGMIYKNYGTNIAIYDTLHITGSVYGYNASTYYGNISGGNAAGVGYKVIIDGDVYTDISSSASAGVFECINAAGILELEIHGNIEMTANNYLRLVGNSDTNNGYHTSISGLIHKVHVYGDWYFRQRNSVSNYPHRTLRGDLIVDGVIYGAGVGAITCDLGSRNVTINKIESLDNVNTPSASGYVYIRTSHDNMVIGEINASPGGVSSYPALFWYPTSVGTLNISVVRGGSMPALQYLGTASGIVNILYLESAGAASPDIFTGKAAVIGTGNKNILTTAVTVQLSSYGNLPVDGPFRFKDATGTLLCTDNNNDTQTLSVQENITIPLETDVRSGVIYGIANSKTGIYDPGLDYAASLLALKNLALDIKAKTDQMNFSGTDIDANVDESNSQLILDIEAVKAQTDQLVFDTVPNMIPDPTNDPYWSSVVFATHFDGANGGTNFIDESGKDISIIGTVTNSTTQFKYNTSAYFNGSGNLSCTNPTSFILGTADFTVELWFYKSSGSSTIYQRLIEIGLNSAKGGLWICVNGSTANECRPFIDTHNGTTYSSPTGQGPTTVTQDTWHHLVVTRIDDLWTIYIDGSAYSSGTLAGYNISADIMYIGGNNTGSERFNGYIDDIRITKGLARYTTNFTPPTETFTTYSLIEDGTVTAVKSDVVSGNIIASGTTTGGTCDLTAVESSLSTISSSVTAVKAKTDQLVFTSGAVNSHPDNSATVTSISTNLGTANSNITAIKDQTDQLMFDTVSVTEYVGGDPSWANVSLLLHGNGTSGSTNIIDETGKIVTVNGNTNINTTTKKYGTGSIYFDGAGDYLSLADSSSFGLGVEDFTVECWVNTASSSDMAIVDNRTTTHPGVFYLSGGHIGYYDPTSGDILGTTTVNNNTWNHLAWVRNGSSLLMFVNGVLDATISLTSQDFGSSRPLRIGTDYVNASAFLGYLDDIRITKGLARHTANFTPPVTELLGQGTPNTYDQTQVIASGTDGGGTCDLTTVNNTLSTISGNVVSNGTNINAIKAKTDQLNFNGTKVLSDPALTIPDYTTRFDDIDASLVIIDSEVDNVQLDVTSIKAKTDQLTFNGSAVVADDGHAATLTSILSTIGTIDAAVTLIEEATSKLGFEEIHGEADPNFAQVTFIAEMEGTNGQNTYTAEVGDAATFGGNVVLSSVTSRLGNTSMNFGGANYAAFSNNSADNLGGNDFTIECSFYPTAIPASGDYNGIFCKRNSNATMSWLLYMDGTSSSIVFLTGGTNPVSITHTIPLSVNQWYDCTISRTGNTIKFFVNGVLVSTSCTGMVCATVSAPVMMGKLSYDLGAYYFNGYIDHARITVGTGRYDLIDPVSPPVAAYPLSTLGTLLGYKVVANCDSTVAIPADLTDRLNDLRARINAVHFTVDGQ